jgi:hypothetical protein
MAALLETPCFRWIQGYCTIWVQFDPPAGSDLIVPPDSRQNPRSPVFPTVAGVAVKVYPVTRSELFAVDFVQLVMLKM